jgi:3-oxoacyl-[acyl-carrier-protein] synthase-3
MPYARIAGTGHYLPERVVTNQDLEKLMDTSDAWIQERSGIKERHFADPGTGSARLGVLAAQSALESAGWTPEDVEFIVFATLSPDYYTPGNGVLVGAELGLKGIGALDVRNQCSGFIYGLAVSDGLIRMGLYKRILLIGAEVHSSGLRMTTEGRDTAVLFGDGGGAVCLEATEEEGSRVIWHHLHSDGRYAEELCIRAPSAKKNPYITCEMIEQGLTAPYMNGREVFKHAVTKFPAVIFEALEAQGLKPDDVAMVIPHQANYRITDVVRERLGLTWKTVYSNIERIGNTTAASIPIALDECVREGLVKRGDLLCLASFGSGFTWGASLVRY